MKDEEVKGKLDVLQSYFNLIYSFIILTPELNTFHHVYKLKCDGVDDS